MKYSLKLPPEEWTQPNKVYDRKDNSVGALEDSWVLNLDSLGQCLIDKSKLREWRVEQEKLFKEEK